MAVYIGADGQAHHRDDELRHYKYIKREKLPNGKWRYYYDVAKYQKDIDDANVRGENGLTKNEEAARDEAKFKTMMAESKVKAAEKTMARTKEMIDDPNTSKKEKERNSRWYDEASKKREERLAEVEKAKAEERDVAKQFFQTRLESIRNVANAGERWFKEHHEKHKRERGKERWRWGK